MLNDIVAEVGDADGPGGDARSARRIASVIGRMITSGRPAGRHPAADRARAVAAPRGVADHGQRGVAQPRRRRGDRGPRPQRHLRPARRPGPGGPRRYRRITEGPGHFELDLSPGTPDPALLPDLGPVVSRVGKQSLTSSYLDHPVLPALEDELVASWPFPPEAITVVDGAMDALDRVAQVVLRLGDRVVVEHPELPAAARPPRPARLRRRRRRRRRRGRGAGRACAQALGRRARGPCSCSRGPRTRPARR